MDAQKARMIPYSSGPKRLAFHIRKTRTYGSTSLLISNRFGVWSAVRSRHVKKTRFLRFQELKHEAGQLEKGYVSLRKLNANDEKVTSWRRRLADFYWDAAPARYKAHAMKFFWEVKRSRWHRRLVVAVLLVSIFLLQAWIIVSGAYPLWFSLGCAILGDAILCVLGVDAWRDASDRADVVLVELLGELEHLPCSYLGPHT